MGLLEFGWINRNTGLHVPYGSLMCLENHVLDLCQLVDTFQFKCIFLKYFFFTTQHANLVFLNKYYCVVETKLRTTCSQKLVGQKMFFFSQWSHICIKVIYSYPWSYKQKVKTPLLHELMINLTSVEKGKHSFHYIEGCFIKIRSNRI